uniref:Uncharacterized protein n=2 Tax=viral metagenome TaxID=1070528 RepID=A0A6H1ZRL6_9ZZZZ
MTFNERNKMKIANKLCYPQIIKEFDVDNNRTQKKKKIGQQFGLTFRERLIIALASNPKIACYEPDEYVGIDGINVKRNTQKIIFQTDAIIKELD